MKRGFVSLSKNLQQTMLKVWRLTIQFRFESVWRAEVHLCVEHSSLDMLDIYRKEIAIHALSDQLPSHLAMSVTVIVLFFLQELDLLP